MATSRLCAVLVVDAAVNSTAKTSCFDDSSLGASFGIGADASDEKLRDRVESKQRQRPPNQPPLTDSLQVPTSGYLMYLHTRKWDAHSRDGDSHPHHLFFIFSRDTSNPHIIPSTVSLQKQTPCFQSVEVFVFPCYPQASASIISEHNMDNVPIKGLCELEAHLQQLNDDPSLPFQVDLLEDVELQLTGKSTRQWSRLP